MTPITLSRNDWALHRKGPADAARHAEKVKEAIKESLPQVIAEEAIITGDGNTVVKVPIRSLELPRFRFDFGRNKHVGQGEGEGDGDGQAGTGKGQGAGNAPGFDYLEAELTLDELAEIMFADFALPNLEQKQTEVIETNTDVFREVVRKGAMSNLDKRRTIRENLKRNALLGGRARFGGIREDDLRFRICTPDVRRETNAVIVAMRDVSGSMGEFEKYITRSFYFWMLRFLRSKYERVQVVFITHHTEAKEVDEETFFHLGESGGTKVSSAYQLALEVIGQRYDPSQWNVYPFHFSDGDNWGDSDNRRCVELVGKLLEVSSALGYGEIRQGGSRATSTLMSALGSITHPKFIPVVIEERKDVYEALRAFFTPRVASDVAA